MDFLKEYEKWLSCPYFSEDTKAELKNITDAEEIEDRFYKHLSFGTGGLRGVIGAGNNRINEYTVGCATKGLCNYLKKTGGSSVVIAYDSRFKSDVFAMRAALVFAANGIRAYLFDSLRPTPELSFAVRALKASAGVVITASHNPPEYNGYKVYNKFGGQIVPPEDKLIVDEVAKISVYDKIDQIDKDLALKRGLLEFIGEKIDDLYVEEIKKNLINKEALNSFASELKVVYTPLNGSGLMPVKRVLNEIGVKNLFIVKEQENPDGNFPTLKTPNPEDPSAFDYALKLAEKVDADLIIATDPDADRLGVYLKGKEGFLPLTGNQSGALLCEYVVSERKRRNLLPEKGIILSTIVSGKLGFAIAKEYGLLYDEVLTGFKYIGDKMREYDQNGNAAFVFGYEESYGCLPFDCARDKDAVAAAATLCEMAAAAKQEGVSLESKMSALYEKYGYYTEKSFSVVLKGVSGAKRIAEKMENLRNSSVSEIAGKKVLALRDYQSGKRYAGDEVYELKLPKSNVLYFELAGGWCCVRPSGTEPKIKFYAGVVGKDKGDANKNITKITEWLKAFAEG